MLIQNSIYFNTYGHVIVVITMIFLFFCSVFHAAAGSGYAASLLMDYRIDNIPDFRQPLPQPFQDGVGFIAVYSQ